MATLFMESPYGVVDIFSGPGGLAEGFSRAGAGESSPYKVELSIESDSAAHRTLRLRSFVHEFGPRSPDFYLDILNSGHLPNEAELAAQHPDEWSQAERIAKRMTLAKENRPKVEELLDPVKKKYHGRTILIGGPPCQVYSLVGRSRNATNHKYEGDKDHRHRLYQEYIHILKYLRPAVFVMENVKGMLSSEWNQQGIFSLVRRDLESVGQESGDGYSLLAVGGVSNRKRQLWLERIQPDHRDFIVRSEQYGVPQRRHRLIVIGIRNDLAQNLPSKIFESGLLTPRNDEVRAETVLKGMPNLRSGLSRGGDSRCDWIAAVAQAFDTLAQLSISDEFDDELKCQRARFDFKAQNLERRAGQSNGARFLPDDLRSWLVPDGLHFLPNNETRSHIPDDLVRYLFASVFAKVAGVSPKAPDFPNELAPAHRNWKSGKFADRFRVQVEGRPATTITSHISKDGHYFIHPDPVQCRSLTVREAARLQTFPDDYIFLGTRTQQYVQVGNAVPPFLARQIARSLLRVLER